MLALRSVAQALAAYAESLAAEGNDAEAAACLGPILRFGHTLQSNTSLIEGMIGIAIQAIGADAVTTALHPGSKLTPAQWWQELAATLQSSLLDEDIYMQKLENEYFCGSELFRHSEELARVRAEEPQLNFIGFLPGMWAREERIYNKRDG